MTFRRPLPRLKRHMKVVSNLTIHHPISSQQIPRGSPGIIVDDLPELETLYKVKFKYRAKYVMHKDIKTVTVTVDRSEIKEDA